MGSINKVTIVGNREPTGLCHHRYPLRRKHILCHRRRLGVMSFWCYGNNWHNVDFPANGDKMAFFWSDKGRNLSGR